MAWVTPLAGAGVMDPGGPLSAPEPDPGWSGRRAELAAVDAAAAALDAYDHGVAEHSQEVARISERVCEALDIEGRRRQRIVLGARLHDVGKLAISTRILDKRGRLSEEEWAVIRTHTVVGERILQSVPELARAASLVRHSHERWDGSGYPDGLSGERIPLGSRIIACADAYQTITAGRPYQPGRPPSQALAELRSAAGTQFDPTVVEALAAALFLEPAARHAARVRRPRLVRRTRRRGAHERHLPARRLALGVVGVLVAVAVLSGAILGERGSGDGAATLARGGGNATTETGSAGLRTGSEAAGDRSTGSARRGSRETGGSSGSSGGSDAAGLPAADASEPAIAAEAAAAGSAPADSAAATTSAGAGGDATAPQATPSPAPPAAPSTPPPAPASPPSLGGQIPAQSPASDPIDSILSGCLLPWLPALCRTAP